MLRRPVGHAAKPAEVARDRRRPVAPAGGRDGERHLVGDTCADGLDGPDAPAWDTLVKAVPHLLGVLETIEDRAPLGAWALDRLGHLTSLSSCPR